MPLLDGLEPKDPPGGGPDNSRRPLKVLHSSDWHLGRGLGKLKRRHGELGRFLEWLLATIESEGADVLLVAGDVFDTVAPPTDAQALYYGFLGRLRETRFRHVVITSGNHDSPSFLAAPGALLKTLGVHVVAEATTDPRDELLVLRDPSGEPMLIVAAVPFLRDREVRAAVEGEDIDERDRRLAEGVGAHYDVLAGLVKELKGNKDIPVVAMGHLFARGGAAHEGDGTREAYVGSLSRVDTGSFSTVFDYVALGHLHGAQRAGRDTIRYSGSPIHMGFREAGEKPRPKSVTLVEFSGGPPAIREIPIPIFQELLTIQGDLKQIEEKIAALKAQNSSAWLEVLLDGEGPEGDLKQSLDSMIKGSDLEVLIYKDLRAYEAAFGEDGRGKPLKEYTVGEVFDRVLSANNIPDDAAAALKETFERVLFMFNEGQDNG
jgi:exonuclease SbcD